PPRPLGRTPEAPDAPRLGLVTTADHAKNRARAEEYQVGVPRQLEPKEQRLRGGQQGTDTKAGDQRPRRLPGSDADRCEHASDAAAEQCLPTRQRDLLSA